MNQQHEQNPACRHRMPVAEPQGVDQEAARDGMNPVIERLENAR